MSSCSAEINKGNTEFLAPVLGNTQTCSLVLYHHFCLPGATWDSSLTTCISWCSPCQPERSPHSSAACLPSCREDVCSLSRSEAVFYSPSVEVPWVRSQWGLGSTEAPAAHLAAGELCPAGTGHLELLWAADGQIRLRNSLFLSDSLLPAASQWEVETVLPSQGDHRAPPREKQVRYLHVSVDQQPKG